MPNDDEVLLIDFSAVLHPVWHMTQNNPDPNATATQVVDRICALATDHPHAVVCCDSGRSFRSDLDPTYKAQRPETDAPMLHQARLAEETLRSKGFPVWKVKGFEADDIIASATAQALAINGTSVLVATNDKDLMQLVGDRVQVKSLKDGTRLDAAWVQEKFGVPPAQIRDYLTLVGDSSDNIKGAFRVGPKKATELLTTFGSLDEYYAAFDKGEAKLPRAIVESLTEFRERMPTVRELVTLRVDVPLPFAEIAAERTPHDTTYIAAEEETPVDDEPAVLGAPLPPSAPPQQPANGRSEPQMAAAPPPPPPAAPPRMTVEEGTDALAPAPGEWTKQLEPRSMRDATMLAKYMHEARLFSGYGTPQAVLSTILAGRELGFNSVASLRAFNIIDGRHALAADAMRGLVLRSGVAKYFRIIERAADHCTWETWRSGDPEPIRLTFTIQQARTAWQKDERAWNNSAYTKNPEDMLSARASSKLCRLVYADILFALYAPEELRDEVA